MLGDGAGGRIEDLPRAQVQVPPSLMLMEGGGRVEAVFPGA